MHPTGKLYFPFSSPQLHGGCSRQREDRSFQERTSQPARQTTASGDSCKRPLVISGPKSLWFRVAAQFLLSIVFLFFYDLICCKQSLIKSLLVIRVAGGLQWLRINDITVSVHLNPSQEFFFKWVFCVWADKIIDQTGLMWLVDWFLVTLFVSSHGLCDIESIWLREIMRSSRSHCAIMMTDCCPWY